jgi:hypothetical protein
VSSNYRIAATLLSRDMVCFRDISVNIVHKGDDDDDDIDDDDTLLDQIPSSAFYS